MQSVAEELENKTLIYWSISQAFNRGSSSVRTDTAIEVCNNLRYGMNPARPIVRVSTSLLGHIIEGEVAEIPSAKILKLAKQG